MIEEDSMMPCTPFPCRLRRWFVPETERASERSITSQPPSFAGSRPTAHLTDRQLPNTNLSAGEALAFRSSHPDPHPDCFPWTHTTPPPITTPPPSPFTFSTPEATLLTLPAPRSPLVRNVSVWSARHGGRILKQRRARRGWR